MGSSEDPEGVEGGRRRLGWATRDQGATVSCEQSRESALCQWPPDCMQVIGEGEPGGQGQKEGRRPGQSCAGLTLRHGHFLESCGMATWGPRAQEVPTATSRGGARRETFCPSIPRL